MKHSLDNTSR